MYLDQSMPLCENGCGKQSIRITKKGKAVCSNRPAGCPAVLKKMQETSIKKYGVPNASSTEEVKYKRKLKSLEKYGVDNVSKADDVRAILSMRKKEYWNNLIEDLISKTKNTQLNMTRKQYEKTVAKITNYMYRRYIDTIDPERKRGNNWHLDHSVSRYTGFYLNVPPHIIGDINNLKLIPGIINETKRHTNSITVKELYDRYNQYYLSNEAPDIDAILSSPNNKTKPSIYTEKPGTCSYCGMVAHYKYESEKWCCSPHRNQCSAIKEKNSTSQKNSEKKKIATKRRVNRHLS